MLRIKTKNKLNSIFDLQIQLHQQIVSHAETIRPEVLNDCQQAAIIAGQQLELELPERTDIITKLEDYCEMLYQLDQNPSKAETAVEHLDELIESVKEKLAELLAVYQAVFMPYKAEMWDSLESVWMAFDKDENCEALVIPLPYSKYDAGTRNWNSCYEGERFPEYVPITNYCDYQLEENYPEFIFIHNAYDEYNLVTRINPEYFCCELKKYTKTLVYIPYYLTSGFVSEEHKMLSGYRYVDYMIVQSELFKSGLEGSFIYDKALPLGSPKLDRVLRISRKDRPLPVEWKEVVGDKKCIMLNTSLGYFLHFGEYYLRRVKLCIDWLKEHPIVTLIWRPHPLFESTIQSLRPNLLEKYQELVEYFLSSGIGILDRTPDIANTIAAVDAYIGDSWTSVTNLFGAAGRPMFILDASKSRPYTLEEQRRVSIAGMVEEGGKLWIVPLLYNGLLCVEKDGDWNKVRFVHRFIGQPSWSTIYLYVLLKNHRFYFTPLVASQPVCYDLETGEDSNMGWDENGKSLLWRQHFVYGESIFYISTNAKRLGIIEYDDKKKTWTEHTQGMVEFCDSKGAGSKDSRVADAQSDGRYIWIVAMYTNRVLCFDMKYRVFKFFLIGPEEYGYSSVCQDGDILYLAEGHGNGTLLEVKIKEGTFKEYSLPKQTVWRDFYQRERALGRILNFGQYLVIAPGYAHRLWRFEKQTGKFCSLADAFWRETEAEFGNYLFRHSSVWNFIQKGKDKKLLLQRTMDDAILVLDVGTGDYEVKYMYLSEDHFESLMEGQDGFQKDQISAPFVQMESRYFQFEEFVRNVAEGKLESVKRRQREELITLAANMDGDCGEKVYEYFQKR